MVFVVTLVRFVRAVRRSWKDPESRGLLMLVALTLASGTLFYHQVEKWGFLDSFYFCVITLTTVGYGDLSPTTALGKIFTVIYIFVGIGIILGFVDLVAKPSTTRRSETRGPRRPRGGGREEEGDG